MSLASPVMLPLAFALHAAMLPSGHQGATRWCHERAVSASRAAAIRPRMLVGETAPPALPLAESINGTQQTGFEQLVQRVVGRDALERVKLQLVKGADSLDPWQSAAVTTLSLLPAVGFFSFPIVASFIRSVFESFVSFQNVDGNTFAVELLRPTVNGVVLPACAITFGTLLATTVNVLRNRQVEMRACISKEACQLRLLRQILLGMYGTAQHSERRKASLVHLHSYVTQCVTETTPYAFDELALLEERGGFFSVNELEDISKMLHGIDGAAACRDFSVGTAQSTIVSLNELRSDRLAQLLSGFPAIHWLVLGVLSSSIVLLYLIDSNQDVLQFLNSLQLRLLFSILLSTFAAIALLCLDLADPFRGVTTISNEALQLRAFQATIERDLAEAEIELRASELRSANPADHARLASDRGMDRPGSWGVVDTVYFHLLTGKLGSTVRFLGDGLAWTGRRRPRFLRRSRQTRAQQAAIDGAVEPPQSKG